MDAAGTFLERTNSSAARKLLKENKATIHSKDPFTIRLTYIIENPQRKKTMAILNHTEYFKTERNVYIQNLSSAQISLSFPIEQGMHEPFLLPNMRDPINLTQYFPFDVIKRSMDLRKLLARRPPVLQLLDDEEYVAYFTKKAVSKGLSTPDGKPNIDAAISVAEDQRARLSNKGAFTTSTVPKPLPGVVESDGSGPNGEARFGERNRVRGEEVSMDEIIKGRVLHLMAQVNPELPEEQRMPAMQLIQELEDIPDMAIEDWECVRAQGYYKSAKTLAKKKIQDLVDAQEATETVEA